MPETASEKEQLWQLGEARVFDQMTSNQASGGLKHDYYHLSRIRTTIHFKLPALSSVQKYKQSDNFPVFV